MIDRPYRNAGFLLAASVLLFLLALQFSDHPAFTAPLDATDRALREMQTFVEAYRIVQADYVDTTKLNPRDLIAGAIKGMLATLGDQHVRYLPPDDANELIVQTEGEFGGIGIHIGLEDDRLAVISPVEGTPAWRAGVEAGDVIARINGDTTDGMSPDVAVTKLRGKPGTQVNIELERRGYEKPIPLTLTREIIRFETVRATVHDGLGYIRLSQFSERTSEDLDKAIRQVTAAKVSGIILDLRENSGGVLTGAIGVMDRFVDSGVIVSVVSRDPSQTRTYTATADGVGTRLPLVILVNGASASASEIVAGAVQDLKRGVLVGTKTYGKGSVQTIENLPDGSKIALTTARYFTPSGRSIHGTGITPDVVVESRSLSDTDRRMIEALYDTNIVREFAWGKDDYNPADVLRLRAVITAAGIDLPEDIVEMLLVRELSRRHADRIYLVPHVDPQIKKAIEILKAGRILEAPTLASRP